MPAWIRFVEIDRLRGDGRYPVGVVVFGVDVQIGLNMIVNKDIGKT